MNSYERDYQGAGDQFSDRESRGEIIRAQRDWRGRYQGELTEAFRQGEYPLGKRVICFQEPQAFRQLTRLVPYNTRGEVGRWEDWLSDKWGIEVTDFWLEEEDVQLWKLSFRFPEEKKPLSVFMGCFPDCASKTTYGDSLIDMPPRLMIGMLIMAKPEERKIMRQSGLVVWDRYLHSPAWHRALIGAPYGRLRKQLSPSLPPEVEGIEDSLIALSFNPSAEEQEEARVILAGNRGLARNHLTVVCG